jgi:hypothetical protein
MTARIINLSPSRHRRTPTPRRACDRADRVTIAILQIVADHMARPRSCGLDGLHDALTEYVRDEVFDIQREVLSEIRPVDE